VKSLLFRSLKEKGAQVEWRNENRHDKFILFSRSGFTDEMQKLASADGVMLVHGDKIIMSTLWHDNKSV
jgi:hypothetical protein